MSESHPTKVQNSLLHSDTLSRVLGSDVMQILRCGICMDFFEVPIVLPCGHTFCLQCLTKMCTHASLTQTPNTAQDVRIGCPNCRVLIYATPILRRNVTCNFIIQSLLECLRAREDRPPLAQNQNMISKSDDDGVCGGIRAMTSSSSSTSSKSTRRDNEQSQEEVMRIVNNFDRMTSTMTKVTILDHAFLEIEEIRNDHYTRERQRQAERDAKTRDQVRAVQDIVKQSREEHLQHHLQQKQHRHHHQQQQQLQQQQQQQQQQQPTQRLILPRSQPQPSKHLSLGPDNDKHKSTAFPGNNSLSSPSQPDNSLILLKQQQQQHMQLQQQQQQQQQQQRQHQMQQQTQKYVQQLLQSQQNRRGQNPIHTIFAPQYQQHQQRKPPPPPPTPIPQQTVTISNTSRPIQLYRDDANVCGTSTNASGVAEKPVSAPSEKSGLSSKEGVQEGVSSGQPQATTDEKSQTSGSGIQLNNDPAVMSFSLAKKTPSSGHVAKIK